MTECMAAAFENYGLAVSVTHNGAAVQTKALLQRVRREKNGEPIAFAPLGAAEERIWRYLGPASVTVCVGDTVSCESLQYTVRDCAAVYLRGEVIYYWAILHPKEEAA